MPRPNHLITATVLAASLWLAAPSALAQAPAADLIKWAPADADLVGGVNLRAAAVMPLFKSVLDSEFIAPELDASVDLLRLALDLSGSNRPERGAFWGRKGDADSAVVVIGGNVNQERFLTDLKARPDYASKTQDGVVLHRWIENSGQRHHYAAFLNSGTLALGNRPESLLAAHRAGTSGKSFTKLPAASLLPADRTLTGFALMRAPERLVPPEYGSDTMKARAGLFTFKPQDDKNRIEATVFADSQEAAQQWGNMANGMVALMPWQVESPALAEAIRSVHVKQRVDNSVSASLVAPPTTIIELMHAP